MMRTRCVGRPGSLPFVAPVVLAAALVLSLFAAPPVLAQDGEAAPPDVVVNPDVPLDELAIRHKPMRVDALEAELNAWVDAIEDCAKTIAERRLEGATDEALADELALRSKLAERANRTLIAFENKGGEAETQKKYIIAATEIQVDVLNPAALWATIKTWSLSTEGGLKWLRRILAATVILIAFWILARIVARILRRALAMEQKMSALLEAFLIGLVRKTVILIGIIVALGQLDVNIGPMLAAIGAAGFIIGFAVQGTLSNFAAGVMILLYRPFDIGDWVSTAGVSGSVKQMTLVSTTITTADNQVIIVPNNAIWGDVITNVTGNDTRRIDLTIGVGYDDDLQKTASVLEEVVKAHPKVLDDPAPNIKVHELADSSVNFVVRPWTRTSDYWEVRWDLMKSIKERLDAEDISIPYPQMDVHMPDKT